MEVERAYCKESKHEHHNTSLTAAYKYNESEGPKNILSRVLTSDLKKIVKKQ